MDQQKVAVVTGVSSGIGMATAAVLAHQGFRVFGTVRTPIAPESETHNPTIVALDVREEESVRSCVEVVLHQAGRIDALVNNAGYALIGALEETSIEEAQELFETNFFGVLRMSKAVLPIFRKQGSGRIVNIGSSAGFLPTPYQAIYAASKHAIEGYSESLDHEVRQFGIRVSVVEPGFTKTKMALNARLAHDLLEPYRTERRQVVDAVRQNIKNGEDPLKIASVVLEAIISASPQMIYLAGRDTKLVSLLRKFAPSSIFDRGLRKQFGLSSR